jgi:putative NADH-flavin reductase
MKILILGATGRLGKKVLETALQSNYEVNVLVRDAKKITLRSDKLFIYEGDCTQVDNIQKALKECDAVVNTLNISRINDFPWAPLRTPKDFLSKTMLALVEAMNTEGVKRLALVTACGVNESHLEMPAWFRWLIRNSNIKYPYADHALQEDILRKTDLDWTIIRPVGLTNGALKTNIQTSINGTPKPSSMISRVSVAAFILNCLNQDTFIKQCPTVSNI